MYPSNPKKVVNKDLERTNPLYLAFSTYNAVLNDEDATYSEKCKIIPKLWLQISVTYVDHKLNDVVDVMEWAKLHTLEIVLDGSWSRHKDKVELSLLKNLLICEQKLGTLHEHFPFHINGLLKVVRHPWDNTILRRMLQDPVKDSLTDEDVALFAKETGYATAMRIKKLINDQCEDFALNLCKCYLKCLKLFEDGKVLLVVTDEQKKYTFDVFISLLYRLKQMDTIFESLKPLSDEEATEFVERFSKKDAPNCKVWKTAYKVTFLSAMVFLDRHAAMVKAEERKTVTQILESWLTVVANEEDVIETICAIKNLLLRSSCSAYFIYTVIESVKFFKRFTGMVRLKHLKVELYIRALTKDINHLEHQRGLKDELSVKSASQSVAAGLLQLAVELDDHLSVARECVLSAFSVFPTEDTLKMIEQMAQRWGYEVLDTGQWLCKFHAPLSEDDELAIQCHVCKDFMLPITLKAFNTNTTLSEALTAEKTGLPQELCDDLVIVLCSPRYQLLSWLQEWLHLHRLCIMYLDNPETTKNYITELKFVQIDYSLFINKEIKLEPGEEENLGYDKVWIDSEPEFAEEIEDMTKRRRARLRRLIDSDDEYETPPSSVSSTPSNSMPRLGSAPDVLKQLRSFRKRKSDTSVEASPMKVVAREEFVPIENNAPVIPNIPINNFSPKKFVPSPCLPSTSSNTDRNFGPAALNLSMDRFQPMVNKSPKVVCIENPDWSPFHEFNTPPSQSSSLVRYNSFVSEGPPLDLSPFRPNPSWTSDPFLYSDPAVIVPLFTNVPEVGSEEVVADAPSVDFDPFQEIDRLLTNTNCEPIPDVILEEPFAEEIIDCFASPEKSTNDVMERDLPKEAPKKEKGGKCMKVKKGQKEKCQPSTSKLTKSLKRPNSQLEYLLTKPKASKSKQVVALDNFEETQGCVELAAKHNYKPIESIVSYIQKPIQEDIITAARNESFPDDVSMPLEEEDVRERREEIDTEDCRECKEVKVERPPKILTADNSLAEQKPQEIVCEQTNQEKSLFREKDPESVLVEQPSKVTKKNHRELKENKENAMYLPRRRITRKPYILEQDYLCFDLKKKKEKKKSNAKRASSGKPHKSTQGTIDTSQYNLKDCNIVLERLQVPEGTMQFIVPDEITTPGEKKYRGKSIKNKNRRSREGNTKPLSDKNLCVDKVEIDMNPKVILQRIDIDKYNAKKVLANVPGMKDTGLIQPQPVQNVVQVVQTTGRPNNSTTSTQTSTQVTPHIQRIGQPRIDKPENSDTTATTTTAKAVTTNAKPTTTHSSLINILSHNVIRQPGQPVGRPVVNILSHQIIRPANSTAPSLLPTRTTINTTASSVVTPRPALVTTTPVVVSRPIITTTAPATTSATLARSSNLFALQSQPNNSTRVSSEPQIINQLATSRSTTGTGPTIKVAAASESSRIVQFICQSSDGKLIPVSSFTQNCVVKVASSNQASPNSPCYEDNFTKVQTKPKPAESNSENPETLPKFQQAFGKSVYQNKSHATNSTNTTNNVEAEKSKVAVVQKTVVTTTTTTTVKPIPGGVIYTRQVQSGGTINLIPQSRGQVFRIATSTSDQISVVKDTIIQNKMSALLAAALSKKDSDDSESEKGDPDTTLAVTTAAPTRVAITRPSARIVKPVLQIPGSVTRNAPQTNLSSTTLEQLREFDMVYKQVKERSSTTPASEASSNSESPESQCISVTYLNQGQKINCAPIVVVSSYSAIQPVSSPALSVVSQGNTSPRVTPSPSQTSVLPKVTPKTSKGKTVKTPTSLPNTSKASPIPKPQQKPQEDEHTTQRIFDILAEYAEQLRNSPDLNNKPAPRRRSNPPTNPSQNSKRKKSSSSKKPAQGSSLSTEPDTEDPRTLGSEDSSCGVMQLSVPDDDQPTTLASTSESNDSTCTPRQQLILTDSSNQTRNLIIAESSVGEALKMPNTAVLVPGNYIMPVSMVKGGQQIAVVSGGSKILATVPARSGPNMLLFQSFLNQSRKTSVPTVKYSTIQPISGISSQSLAGVTAQPPVILPPLSHGISAVTLGQPITVKKLDNCGQVNTELLLTISQSRETDSAPDDTPQPDSSTNIVSANIETVEIEETTTISDNSSEKSFTAYQKPLITTPIATPVIAQTSTANITTKADDHDVPTQTTPQTVVTLINTVEQKGDTRKTEERLQTVLVTANSSNGPMMTQSRSNFKETLRTTTATTVSQPNKDEFLRNNDKKNNDTKNFQGNNVYTTQGKTKKVQATQRLDRELQQLCLQRKQAALERELRLQKSLSEECEDLGVDEPSTSDLFPEAELLFDSNHSPSYEQSDLTKRIIVQHEAGGKEEAKLTLFTDDDFLFEAEYRGDDGRSRLLTNGQTESEDTTLLQTCTSMSDVTLNSPISPETYRPTTPPPLHKYVHKYSNRKRSDKPIKQVESWTGEVSSSEDTTGSSELIKTSSSPEICLGKITEEELADGNFKVVRVAIAKRECGDCSEEGDCSLSGRGARRTVKKLCSCCNGAGPDSRKRPAPSPQLAPIPQKKVFPVKKR